MTSMSDLNLKLRQAGILAESQPDFLPTGKLYRSGTTRIGHETRKVYTWGVVCPWPGCGHRNRILAPVGDKQACDGCGLVFLVGRESIPLEKVKERP